MKTIENITADVLIVGAGLAGLYTALNIQKDKKIVIVSKEALGLSNSYLAQGGIAGELNTSEEALSKHIEDTLIAGAGLFDKEAIKELVYDASENLKMLIDLGVPFDVDKEGHILLTKEAGHSTRRILHAGGDATGKKIMETLIGLIRQRENVTILENYMMYDLIVENQVCFGGKLIDAENQFLNVFATSIVLATGGIGAVYKDSTNAHGATGDGIAAAYRAGVVLQGMEFVQFHPTVFYDVTGNIKGQKFLISEAVRGEEAYLVNINGERFMQKYDARLELAPRDIVSQSIMKEMYDTWSQYVYIDARHLGKDFLEHRFPTIYAKCLESGYHMESDLVPVAPVEHYGIGGIKINLDGETSMSHLYASGECCSSGVHGANRLASNSLLECIVFGKRIAKKINDIEHKTIVSWDMKIDVAVNKYNYHPIREEIRDTMNKYVFIVRDTEGLHLAQSIINRHYKNLCKHPFTTVDYYRALNIATVAKLITDAAEARKESIGCHLRIH
ncbi:MAG: L-aspartate oxidase [Prevotella sp.]|nr:L-aspartate oxidase [Staphylococcus sp.]MCM1349858.1 L-aspartate oxidase [Prevotella sp.]